MPATATVAGTAATGTRATGGWVVDVDGELHVATHDGARALQGRLGPAKIRVIGRNQNGKFKRLAHRQCQEVLPSELVGQGCGFGYLDVDRGLSMWGASSGIHVGQPL